MPKFTLEFLHNMELHQEITTGDLSILRVPSGWIYSQTNFMTGRRVSTFVPELEIINIEQKDDSQS